MWGRKKEHKPELRVICKDFTLFYRDTPDGLERIAKDVEQKMRTGGLIQFQGKTINAQTMVELIVRDFPAPIQVIV